VTLTWWLAAVLALPCAYAQLVLHELAHAASSLALGVPGTRLRVWPGRHPKTGRWSWGDVDYAGNPTPPERAWVRACAPIALAAALSLGLGAAAVLVEGLLVGGALAGWVVVVGAHLLP
jgi:hypothetical protein